MSKIKKIDIDRLACEDGKNLSYLWDSTLPGFGVRVTAGGVKSFIVRYRIRGKQRIKTIGRVSVIDLSSARDEAKKMIAEAMGGDDPFTANKKDIKTVRDLSKAFQEGRKEELKPKTLESYVSLWKHINDAIGVINILELSEHDASILRKKLKGKETTFNRCLSLMLSALKWQGAPMDNHPFKRTKKYREKRKQRILSSTENRDFYADLMEYKANRKAGWRYADMFILLLLTGLRRDEWRLGKWEWIEWDDQLYVLPDNKTGGRTVYLSSMAMALLRDRYENQGSPKSGFIFPSATDKKKPMSWTWRQWDKMRKNVGLDGFRIHDMRHTAGSYAHKNGGLSQRQVADFLGHSRLETSSRYIHDDEKRKTSEIAAQSIADGWKV